MLALFIYLFIFIIIFGRVVNYGYELSLIYILDLPGLLQYLSRLHVLEYRNFGIMKDESLLMHSLESFNCFA